MKKVIALLGICLLIATACPSNKPELPITPNPEESKDPESPKTPLPEYKTYEFQSSKIISLKELKNGGWEEIEQVYVYKHFGDRLKEFAPLALSVSKETLIVKRPYDIIEKHNIAIQNKDGKIYILTGGDCLLCGKKIGEEEVSLNVIFYKLESAVKARYLYLSGQNYGIKPMGHFLDADNEATANTMTVEYLFHLK